MKKCRCGTVHKTDFPSYREIPGCKWASYQTGAKKRKLKFAVTLEYAWDLFIKQNRTCVLSGVPITFGKRGNTASLDRIDSSKGYVEGNVQWVHSEINRMKGRLADKEFVEMCQRVVKWNT